MAAFEMKFFLFPSMKQFSPLKKKKRKEKWFNLKLNLSKK